jgi:histidine triad (HIT) family protein
VGAAKPEDQEVLGHLLLKAGEVARRLGLDTSGFRLVMNHGADGGETVPHLHCHLLGGRPLGWPPG